MKKSKVSKRVIIGLLMLVLTAFTACSTQKDAVKFKGNAWYENPRADNNFVGKRYDHIKKANHGFWDTSYKETVKGKDYLVYGSSQKEVSWLDNMIRQYNCNTTDSMCEFMVIGSRDNHIINGMTKYNNKTYELSKKWYWTDTVTTYKGERVPVYIHRQWDDKHRMNVMVYDLYPPKDAVVNK